MPNSLVKGLLNLS